MARVEAPPVSRLDQPRARGQTTELPLHHTDAFTLGRAMLAVFLVSGADVTNFLDRGNWLRYVILLFLPLVAIIAIRAGHPSTVIRRPNLSDRLLLVLFLVGMVGGTYGKLFNGVKSDLYPIFVPMIIALFYLGTRSDLTDEESYRLLKGLALVMFVYIILSAFVNSGIIPRLQAYRQYKNAQVMYLAMGVSAVLVLRRWILTIVAVLLWLYIFKQYPSGTAFLVGVTTVVTLFLTRPRRANNWRLILVGSAVALVAVLGVLNFTGARNVADAYFSLVNKKNNDNARVALWEGGIQNFQKSPIWGQAFTGEATIFVIRRGGLGQPFKAPFHSDYVLFLSLGGLIGLGLLLGWAVSTELAVYRRYRGFVISGESDKAKLLRVLLVGFNAFFCAAAFNPELTGASRTATIAAIYGLMMLVGRSSQVRPAFPSEPETRRLTRFTPVRP